MKRGKMLMVYFVNFDFVKKLIQLPYGCKPGNYP